MGFPSDPVNDQSKVWELSLFANELPWRELRAITSVRVCVWLLCHFRSSALIKMAAGQQLLSLNKKSLYCKSQQQEHAAESGSPWRPAHDLGLWAKQDF